MQPDFGDFFRQLQRRNQGPKPNARKPNSNKGPGRDINKPAASGTGSKAVQTPTSSTSFPSGSASSVPAPTEGGCPLRKMLGPMAGFVFDKAGNIQCPTPIIQARAMLAATTPIKNLRPQALPVKFLAIGAIAALANIPCGMWREHTKKFSFQWFLAVHASIPFIAMLRKAIIMPKIAIVCTIAAAIAGQAIGAKMERERLKQLAEGAGSAAPAPLLLEAAPVTVAHLQVSKGKAGAPSRHKVKKLTSMLQPAHGAQQQQQLWTSSPTGMPDGADWRMDRPGTGSFKQLLALPHAVAAH
jgi:hypothetical protein